MSEIIRLSNLSKKYFSVTKKISVIKNTNIKIKSGDLVSLVGPSGSGKSTLLHLIALLDKPTSGEVFFKGKNLSKYTDDQQDEIRKKEMSIIYQQNNLLNDFTALENVMIPLIINGDSWLNAKSKSKKILFSMNLLNRINHFPTELSGGEQQRIAVARAIVTKPDLILADEPTGNLDRKTAHEIFNLILKLRNNNRAIIYATHNRELANRADYKLSILDGNIKKINE